ncbi:hypothetical protein RirG_136530 [Rhizophagus irregularis DAOM 197198w]|uniref:Peptidase A2 domain-containing protein n=1 Tax=Rhizophagus irregularis (strain DAOM 197198w) TaxID=1432141 RepID=A0A015KC75_RHIIW|nr:hypothetical protein RirG_136530 [Rhizophagus irregularis DAOM 197198w]
MYDGPVGLDNTNISKRYKWSKKRGEYYDTMEGINRWKEAGGKRGPREDNIVGVRSKDPVDYGNLLNIVEQQGRMIKRMLRKGEIEVVIDSGAAISVITEKLRKELDIPIKGKSNITCTLADGGKIASLGKVNTEIEVYKELVIPVTLDVIDSKQREMIIGNDLLDKWNANINYKERVLELENDEEIIDIPVWYIK